MSGDEDNKGAPTTKGPLLTHSQSINRLKEIQAELERLGERDDLSENEEDYFRTLTADFDEVDQHRRRLERSADLARVRGAAKALSATTLNTGGGKYQVDGAVKGGDMDRDAILEPDSIEDHRFRDPWDLSDVRTFGRPVEEVGTELRARALSAIEKMQGATDRVRQAGTRILETSDDKQSTLARQVLATSSPAYLRAWAKMARGHNSTLSVEEARALDAVRAMSLTDANGGYLVPFQLDPTVVITADGSRNDIRKYARQVVATGDVWNGVSSGAVSWSWDAEASETSDDSSVFGQPKIPVHTARGFVPISIEALEDEANVTAEVARLLAFGKDDLEAVTFATGTGTGQPKGFITALAGSAAEVPATLVETFSSADVYKVHGALPARYRPAASWMANNLIYDQIRQFDAAGGSALWAQIGADRPAALIGKPVGEVEAMDAVVNPAATEANYLLAFGDFSHYVIADRIGMSVEFIPHLFHTANNRPSGQRGWFAYYRAGADVVNPGAFRLLNVGTTA